MDRRAFLKGAALTGGALAAGSMLAACSDSQSQSDGADGDAGGDAEAPAAKPGALVGGTICANDWLGEAPIIDEADVSEVVDVDIVILGSGHAGTQAALAAAQEGATVAVVEKQPEEKFVYFGDDICSYNSEFMTEKGFGGYDLGEITAEFVRRGIGRVSTPIIRMFVENSGEMMDNMVACVPETSDMLDLENGRAIIQIAYGKDNASYYPIEQSGYKAWATTLQTIQTVNPTEVIPGRKLTRLTEIQTYVRWEAESLGAQWFFNCSAETLKMDGDTVVGAYALKEDGTYLQLNAAKGVLLATGDFSGNADMVWNLLSDVAEWGARVGLDSMIGPGRDGMGHKLGCWAGGAMEPHPRPSMNIMGGQPGPWGTSAFLTLNKDGRRFMNEAMAQLAGSACLRQPLGIITSVMDKNYMQVIQSAGLDHGAPNWGFPQGLQAMEEAMQAIQPGPEGGVVPQVGIAGLGEINTHNPEGEGGGDSMPGGDEPNVWCADTLEELLGYLGYSGTELETALAEIEAYNELCASGKDTRFGKDSQLLFPILEAPFYGSVTENTGETSPGLVSLAGLLTDDQLNVMKADRSDTIPGLYAAGNTLGQRYGMGYSTPSAGNSMGMAMTHGRVAGKIMAAL